MQRSLIYLYNKCKKAQEGTEAQPQAHRNVHTFIHHPLVHTHRLAHKHKERSRERSWAHQQRLAAVSNEFVIFFGVDKSFPLSVVN